MQVSSTDAIRRNRTRLHYPLEAGPLSGATKDIQETSKTSRETRRHPVDTQETPGATQETPRRGPGETQEAPRGTQRHPEAPRRHPRGSEAENLKNVDFCMLFAAYLTYGRKSAWYAQGI